MEIFVSLLYLIQLEVLVSKSNRFYFEVVRKHPMAMIKSDKMNYVRMKFVLQFDYTRGTKTYIYIEHAFFSFHDQIKDYQIGICCFFTTHAALRRASKDWLARNQDNVSEWSDMYIRGLLFQ